MLKTGEAPLRISRSFLNEAPRNRKPQFSNKRLFVSASFESANREGLDYSADSPPLGPLVSRCRSRAPAAVSKRDGAHGRTGGGQSRRRIPVSAHVHRGASRQRHLAVDRECGALPRRDAGNRGGPVIGVEHPHIGFAIRLVPPAAVRRAGALPRLRGLPAKFRRKHEMHVLLDGLHGGYIGEALCAQGLDDARDQFVRHGCARRDADRLDPVEP